MQQCTAATSLTSGQMGFDRGGVLLGSSVKSVGMKPSSDTGSSMTFDFFGSRRLELNIINLGVKKSSSLVPHQIRKQPSM